MLNKAFNPHHYHLTSRLRAVSLLLENPRGRTQDSLFGNFLMACMSTAHR